MKPHDHDHVRPWLELAAADRALVAFVIADEERTPALCGLACFHAQLNARRTDFCMVILAPRACSRPSQAFASTSIR